MKEERIRLTMADDKIRKDTYFLGQHIFAQFNHPELWVALEKCAKEIGCHIWDGEPGSPDILALSAFIVIVDRRSIGKEEWQIYCREFFDDAPCLIVDNLKKWPLPKGKRHVQQFDMTKPDSILSIINIVKDTRKRNLPIELQEKVKRIKHVEAMKYDESKGWVKSFHFEFVSKEKI
jgi:hypothetical protein